MNTQSLHTGVTRWAVTIFIIVLIVLRMTGMDVRPMMHDESMFAYYGFVFCDSGHYTHYPLMHGPFQMLGIGTFFRYFGDSAGVARAFICCWSLLMLAVGLLLTPKRMRRWMTLLLLTSPILFYYSRYLHEEMIFNALVLIGVLGFVKMHAGGIWTVLRRVLGPAALVFLLAVKENALFIYADGITFLGALWLVDMFLKSRRRGFMPRAVPSRIPNDRGQLQQWMTEIQHGMEGHDGSAKKEKRKKKKAAPEPIAATSEKPDSGLDVAEPRYWFPVLRDYVFGTAVGVVLVLFIYGTTTPDHTFAPLTNMKASLDYWVGQHQEHRLGGSTHYHLPVLLVYELPLMLAMYLGLALDALQRPRRLQFYAASFCGWFALWCVWAILPAGGPLTRLTTFLHIQPNGSMFMLGCWIVPILAWSVLCLGEHRVLAGWMGWWAACSLFQYSSAGEKVPWLTVNIVLPMYLATGWLWAPLLLRLGKGWRASIPFVLPVMLVLALICDARFFGANGCHPRERLVYNHTPMEFDLFCRQLVDTWAKEPKIPLKQRRVILVGDPTFPGVWYFRRCGYSFTDTEVPALDPGVDLVISNIAPAEKVVSGLDQKQWKSFTKLSLRDHWDAPWPPDDAPGRWWNYYWFREIWPPDLTRYPVTIIQPAQPR